MTDAPPDFVAARDHVLREVVSFARTLRRHGASLPANASLSAAEALTAVGLDDRDRVRAATHATLVADVRDSAVFDEHFPTFWYRLRTGLEATATTDDVGDRSGAGALFSRDASEAAPESVDADADADHDDGERGQTNGESEVRQRRLVADDSEPSWSDTDDDRTRAWTYSAAGDRVPVADEAASTSVGRSALRRFERALSTLAGRRWSANDGRGVDARRALRESVATGGVPISLPTRERKPTAFRCCVLVDVSQSVLDTLDRGFLLSFLEALVADGRAVRVFFFDTDIREVTDVFAGAGGDPVRALERAEVAWGGGTKIGDAIAGLRERWPDAVDRRNVTLVVSDGLDVGDVDLLEREMAWLSRRSGPVLWLNPLAVSARYEPTCRGMTAALPYVDGLFAFAGSKDLVEAARQLSRHGPYGPVGYEHDYRDRRVET